MDNQEKKSRGGRREGAGRPKGDSRIYSFRIERTLADYIDRHDNRTEFLRQCVAASHEAEQLQKWGEVYPATRIQPLTLPLFEGVRVVAGFPIPLDNDELAQDIELLRMLCPHPEASYLIRVQGDSMIDAGIHHGDILIVDKSLRNPSEHEVAVCELNGEYTIKHVVLRQGQAWLVPANREYPEIPIGENDDFSVWGTVTYTIHRPRGGV